MRIKNISFLLILLLTFSVLTFADDIDNAIKLYKNAASEFEEAEGFYIDANKILSKGENNLTKGDIDKMTKLYRKAAEKFNSAERSYVKANDIVARAGISITEEIPTPAPKPKPDETAKKKALARAIAMRAKAKAEVVIHRIEAEKVRRKFIKQEAEKFGLLVVDDQRGSLIRINTILTRGSDKLPQFFYSKLDNLITIMKKYPVYYIKVESYAFDYNDEKDNIKISEKRAKNVKKYLSSKDATKFDVKLAAMGNRKAATSDNSHQRNTRIEILFYRSSDYLYLK